MFANTNLGVLNLGFPDVCTVPVGPVPVPTPFPNLAVSATSIPSQFTVLIECGVAENLATINPISNGNEAGLLLGIMSAMIMGPSRPLLGSFSVFMGGPPATHLTTINGQNGLLPNTVGISLTPAQFKVLVLS